MTSVVFVSLSVSVVSVALSVSVSVVTLSVVSVASVASGEREQRERLWLLRGKSDGKSSSVQCTDASFGSQHKSFSLLLTTIFPLKRLK